MSGKTEFLNQKIYISTLKFHLRFDIVQPPHHGMIQKLRSVDSSWIAVESFTSNQLLLAQIRYLHTSTEFPQFDEFKVSD